MTDYKETLNLPGTSFPMKANLPQREPDLLDLWNKSDLYKKIRKQQAGKEKFLLLDGPPYANGNIHIGHAVNKVLKDMVIKSKTLSDYDAPYIPGWDCHGLPIEHQVEKKKGKVGSKINANDFREACKEYAEKQVKQQKEDFIRLGILGQWDHPYLTSDKKYEAEQIRAFSRIIDNGYLEYGFKPVHWCLDCKSALAEAEVEYQDKDSISIDALFVVSDRSSFMDKALIDLTNKEADIAIPIWTTTPWTLPANEAVVLGEEIKYSLVETELNNKAIYLLMADNLIESVCNRYDLQQWKKRDSIDPNLIKEEFLKHPFYDKQVPLLIGDYVTTDSGTGAVHTAPAHGHDDFMMGKKFDLPLESPVSAYGVYEEETEFFSGQHISKVDELIIEKLEENKTLANSQKFKHSYPHCWRHKTPLIFRATRQWFIAMERENFRENCLNAIKEVEWFPSWGEERIEGMVSGRPDWCISRQRYWGVPIPLFVHKETNELHPETNNLLKLIADRIEKEGINAWFDTDASEFINDDANEYIKSSDTMDVWMDSGLAHHAVDVNFDCIEPIADLYLEGSDQHRGWFQSSLLTSVAMNARAPYKQVLTHGFTVDESGKKMSKSEGNVIAPQAVINNLGADILRLWAASTDYSKEMNISDQILKRNSDAYRRIRNTARFLLSNLSDFCPDKEMVEHEDLLLLDQWVLNRLIEIDEGIKKDYNNYAFHRVAQTLHNFCVVDMGGFYLDVIKDRLYTMQKDSLGRKSAQTVLYYISELLVRWISPILSYTSEEIWKILPGKREESIFLTQWYELSKIDIKSEWKKIQDINEAVSKSLEISRDQNVIGSSLDAELTLYLDQEIEDLLKPFSNELHFLFITSSVKLKKLSEAPMDATKGAGFAAMVKSVDQNKCNRCWHKNTTVGKSNTHPELCSRCEINISEDGESRIYF